MLKNLLQSIAPFLGNMIGGPIGASALQALGAALLGNESATEEDIERALSAASPDALVEIRKIDAEFKEKMVQVGLDEKKIASLDRDSARKREVESGDKIPAILSILLTFGFFGVLLMVMMYPITHSQRAVVDIMLGSLGTAWISVVTYYFGSSHGSSVKTSIIKQGMRDENRGKNG